MNNKFFYVIGVVLNWIIYSGIPIAWEIFKMVLKLALQVIGVFIMIIFKILMIAFIGLGIGGALSAFDND